jgi:hypothetical protein
MKKSSESPIKLDAGQDWRFEQQLKALNNIILDVHAARPLMNVNDILQMLASIQG